jgi:hypothetical protein
MRSDDVAFKGRLRDASADNPGQNKIPGRMSNALQPEYTINGMVHTDDPLSKSKALTFERDGGRVPTFSLHTDDIEGAKSGWQPGQKKTTTVYRDK